MEPNSYGHLCRWRRYRYTGLTTTVTDAAATFAAFSGFEVLELAPAAADAFTLSNFINNQGFTRLDFGDAGGNTITVNNVMTSIDTVRVLAGAAGDTLAFDRLVDTSTNSLTVDLRGVVLLKPNSSRRRDYHNLRKYCC